MTHVAVFLIGYTLLVLGNYYFENAYCTSSYKREIFQIFHPLPLIMLAPFSFFCIVLGYTTFVIHYDLNRLDPLFEFYHRAPLLLIGLFSLAILVPKKIGIGLELINFLLWGFCFITLSISFLVGGGPNIFMIGFNHLFGTETLDIISQARQIEHLCITDDFYGSIYNSGVGAMKLLAGFIFIQYVFLLNGTNREEHTVNVLGSIIMIIGFYTGLYFILGFLSYLIGRPVWRVFD